MTILAANVLGQAVLALGLAALAVFFFLRRNENGKDHLPLPPGPRGLPLLGNLPFLEPNLHHYFAGLAKSYGPVFRLRLGCKPVTVVSSPSAAREVFKDQDVPFANHDVPAAIRFHRGTSPDIFWSPYGPTWRMLRKIAASHVLNAGSIEAAAPFRRREVRLVVAAVWEMAVAGKAMDLRDTLFQMALNTTTKMLWGERVNVEEGKEFQRAIREVIDHVIKPNVADFYPVLAPLDPQGLGRRYKRINEWIDGYLNRIVQSRIKEMADKEVKKKAKDPLETLLKHMQAGDPQLSSFRVADLRNLFAVVLEVYNGKIFQEEGLIELIGGTIEGNSLGIIGASTDSNTTTIEWVMAELLYEPDRMRKAQQELDTVVGKDRVVEESDIPQLRYLGAVLKETLRLHSPSPLLVPRRTSSNCTAGGFSIPAGTAVIINAWAIHRDPSRWEDPEEFKPERFLPEGREQCEFLGGNEFGYLPFGAGRRACPGMALAERLMLFSLASLLHSFEWLLPEGAHLELADTFGIALRKTEPLVVVPKARLGKPELYA
ncbi:hypothetical protein HPP92_015052 [Vanilla planifolia]|uniref:Cytochrome P450 n=1 Tax=Vanilla planifolia TaxID=51239 RepID=A0A835QH48_VANPL|nr:hypothetical protein HPP92_015052 [Vanilla planifolia]